ncbi:RsmB/NOP family class I SAM-dependent RNA methyltransferase [Methylobacterium sp. NEAU 140]|uniref:RsmB/NOP family class I SAM-dependent RNA methyltransferase n=1 Tax=Methylobacterium sp. NEAU 140 TaxID=3064945 RepID=UPI002737211F|nr:RsmB/NOP family class I SAM-dependent RNA methyltransferase [Methylobacterium sp. NEAU 140]MDP4026378.1 RsmB/NOP family class I SAM-dependent RNA methyltransferase [Methylobacterium sp. NEAU 140]
MAPRGRVRNAAEGIEAESAGLGARRAAARAVAELIGGARPPALDEALAQAVRAERLAPADAALARAIATATFRRLGLIRRTLDARLAKGLPADKPRLVALLATATAQILDLAVPDHAAVDLAVRLAKADPRTAHMAGVANAVLRRIARERDAILAGADPLADNAPDWLGRRWVAAYGAERADAIARAHLAGATIDLTPRDDADAWADRLGATRLPTGSLRLPEGGPPIPELPGFAEGAWWVQDAAAALPARLLDVRPGERVLDLCAAPGGKTLQLASRGARVTALDRSAPRLERLRENVSRLRLAVDITVADALAFESEDSDAVLLDAPCSATGTLRRHPDAAWIKTEADIARLVDLQARLVDRAAELVRPGGRLVYCTCSLEPEEGEAQVAAFLARNARFERVPVRPDEVGGLTELIDGNGDLRTLPCHLPEVAGTRGGLDGFFASRLRRTA